MQLTQRDRNIIRLVYRYRFLRSFQIIALMDGSSQQIKRRLFSLYHHGYLERPRAQIDYYHQGGNRSIVYGLGNKGGAFMRQELGSAQPKISWGEKNRTVGRVFLEHALLISDIMVTLELASRETRGIRFLAKEELSHHGQMLGKRQPFQWRVNLEGSVKLGVIPDRVFALEYPDEKGGINRQYFFLEADRGTMPVKRRHLTQTSFYRKLLAYVATWSQSIHQTEFGFNRFRVLTVTSSVARMKSIMEACSGLERGHGLFLFTDFESLRRATSMLTHPWNTARPGEVATLLE